MAQALTVATAYSIIILTFKLSSKRDLMLPKTDDEALLLISVGVVLFGLLTIVAFILDAGHAIFYVFAAITIVMGLYMARSLAKEKKENTSERKKRR